MHKGQSKAGSTYKSDFDQSTWDVARVNATKVRGFNPIAFIFLGALPSIMALSEFQGLNWIMTTMEMA